MDRQSEGLGADNLLFHLCSLDPPFLYTLEKDLLCAKHRQYWTWSVLFFNLLTEMNGNLFEVQKCPRHKVGLESGLLREHSKRT